MECERCGTSFEPYRLHHRFCSQRCRRHAWWERNPGSRTRGRKPFRGIPRQVVGIDSEGAHDDRGDRLTHLVASTGEELVDPDGIDTEAALRWLVEVGATGHRELWSFAFGYDVSMILRDLDPEAIDHLATKGMAYWQNWRIRHLPGKVFSVAQLGKRDAGHGHHQTIRRAVVHDAWPFVQSSFVGWLRDWNLAPAAEVSRIEAMKDQRGDFGALAAEEITAYTRSEVRYLVAGVEVLKDRVSRAGYRPPQWLGPGSVAAQALRRHKVVEGRPPPDQDLDPWLAHGVAQAYYGGRVETAVVGRYPGPVYYYDLNSAYPAALVDLPCLAHARWVEVEAPGTPWALCLLRWRLPKGTRWGPLPGRPMWSVPLRYPRRHQGWYWWREAAGMADQVEVMRVWELERDCDHRPFAWVPELYQRRQDLRAAGDPAEYALKLVLNSTYGKLAQRVGSAPYFEPAWSGLVTAGCRAEIGAVLRTHGDQVLGVMTDGVLASAPLGIEGEPGRLGDWSEPETYAGVDVWQPGFYVLWGEEPTMRTRGFARFEVDPELLRAAWDASGPSGGVTFLVRRFWGYRPAWWRGHPEWTGTWRSDPVEVSYNPRPRRSLEGRRWRKGEDWLPTWAPYDCRLYDPLDRVSWEAGAYLFPDLEDWQPEGWDRGG